MSALLTWRVQRIFNFDDVMNIGCLNERPCASLLTFTMIAVFCFQKVLGKVLGLNF